MAVTKFKQIKKFCDDNGIELICVTSPITPSVMQKLGMGTVNDVLSQFFEEQNVPYYNFNKARLSVLHLRQRILRSLTHLIWRTS